MKGIINKRMRCMKRLLAGCFLLVGILSFASISLYASQSAGALIGAGVEDISDESARQSAKEEIENYGNEKKKGLDSTNAEKIDSKVQYYVELLEKKQTAEISQCVTEAKKAIDEVVNAAQTTKAVDRSDAKKQIKSYKEIKKVGVSSEDAKKIEDIAKQYMLLLDDSSKISSDMIEECVEEAKEKMDAVLQEKTVDEPAAPSSTSDFIMVGGNWMTPSVTYGQPVDIVLPVVNMGMTNLSNVTVTPVISNSVNEWPFVVETSGYTQTIADLPGKGNGLSDMDRRRELTWTFRSREDALSGYYRLQFNVLYYVGTEVENCTLTTYVKVQGASGSGNIEGEGGQASTPRVIVTGFSTQPEKVHAGDDFQLILHLKNTSQRTAVSNMLINFTAPSDGSELDNSYAVFLPTTGSNSVYVDKIAKGGEKDVIIELTAKNDLSQKPYQLDINMEFEDEDYASYTANADVSIPIYQDARFELSKPEVLPETISAGSEANIMFSIYNLGKVTLYNVHVTFEGDAVSGGESYLGKIEAGGTASVDAMVKGETATQDNNPVMVVISYENDAGESFSYKQEIALCVEGNAGTGMLDDFELYDTDFDELEYEEEEDTGSTLLRIVLIVIGIVILVCIVFAVVHVVRKKKQQKENMELLSDLDDEGDDDEIS